MSDYEEHSEGRGLPDCPLTGQRNTLADRWLLMENRAPEEGSLRLSELDPLREGGHAPS